MRTLTGVRFELILAMLNTDPKLYERLKIYFS